MAGSYRRQWTAISTVDELLALILIKSGGATEFVEQIQGRLDSLSLIAAF